MRAKLALIIFIFLALVGLVTGCLKNDGQEANKLITRANKAINDHIAVEKEEIEPLRDTIDKTENSKKGAKNCLNLIDDILGSIESQSGLLKEAKEDITAISKLSVDRDFKTYANMTGSALDADLKGLDLSQKLYQKLRTLYDLISESNLDEDKYAKLGKEIKTLSNEAEDISGKQEQLHAKKDSFYKNKIKK